MKNNAEITYIVNSLEDLHEIAAKFIEDWKDDRLFALVGEMGVGKTTFVKAICDVLGVEDNVSSPTFSIVNEYTTKYNTTLYHFDFYRIEAEQEALDFGIEEYLESGEICLMEWPDKVESLLPLDEIVEVNISEDSTGSRHIIVKRYNE